jgi:hypothetical protein
MNAGDLSSIVISSFEILNTNLLFTFLPFPGVPTFHSDSEDFAIAGKAVFGFVLSRNV